MSYLESFLNFRFFVSSEEYSYSEERIYIQKNFFV